MRTLPATNRRRVLWIVAVVIAIVAVGILLLNNKTASNTSEENFPVVRLDTDHKTYGTAGGLQADSDAVLLGLVLDKGVTKNDSSTPGIPRTEFSVKANKVFKGAVKTGDEVAVVLTGGVLNNHQYVMDDMTWPTQGSELLMYLQRGTDGKYYPLAGGAAIASKNDGSDTFVLPRAVSGAAKATIEVPEADL